MGMGAEASEALNGHAAAGDVGGGMTRPQSQAHARNEAHGSFATQARARSSAHTEIALALMERAHVTLADRRTCETGSSSC
jgi:hypothetical protein